MIKSPTRYDPHAYPDAALERRNLVLAEMQKQRYLSQTDAAAAAKTKLGVQRVNRSPRYPAPYFVEYIKDLIQRDPRFSMLGGSLAERVNSLFKGGLRIYTTIDLQMQRYAEEASREVLTKASDPYNAFVALDPR